jgi:hypothetical protein
MKTNYIPEYVMLAAGVIDSIILILQHVELLDFLKQLLLVLVVFFVIGNILKLVLDIGMQKMADPQDMPDEFDGEDDSPVEEMDAEEHM